MLNVGEIIELKIEKIVFGGEGIGYYKNFAVFVPMSVPNDYLRIRIISSKKSYARGIIEEILSPSSDRVSSSKVSFEDFGGCDFGMLKYEKQIYYKKKMTEEVIEKLSGISNFKLDNFHRSEDVFNYRNKIIEPFSYKDNRIITGFFKKKSHDVFEVEENKLNSSLGNEIIDYLKKLLNNTKLSVYDEIKHTGLLRNIMIRTNSFDEAMVVLIINSNSIDKAVKEVLRKLTDKFSEIKSVYISHNTKKANTLIGEKNTLIYGNSTIKEKINGINFHISPTSFFQINLKQAIKLYNLAISFFSNLENKSIVDAYSGTGTISMLLSEKAKKVYSIEIIKSAIEDGKITAEENNIKNVEFINGKVEQELKKIIDSKKTIDSIIFDPPRKGLDNSTIEIISELGVKEIVYISCNPATLARDLKIFTEKGYLLKRCEGLDMFPQTSHVETIVLLSRLDSDEHINIEVNEEKLKDTKM